MDNKEFAKHCGIKTNRLSVEISRGKVVCEEDGSIDPEHEKNVAFRGRVLAKQENKAPQQIPRSETWVAPSLTEEDDEFKADEEGILPLPISEKRKKHFEAVNAEKNSILLQLKTEKLQGEVIPTAPIETLIFQFKAQMLNQDKITMQAFLNEISHKYSMTADDTAYFKGYYIKLLNNAVEEATTAFILGLDRSLQEFSTKRGVGERM